MKIAFTVCSSNYLAQARILIETLLRFNAEYKVYLFIVDKKIEEIDYSLFSPARIVFIESLFDARLLENLCKKYNIIELNTSVKASCVKYIMKAQPGYECIFYFDPDIMIFRSLENLEKALDTSNILLTPHITSPIDRDNHSPTENLFLNCGIYNLGFIGISKYCDQVGKLFDWWEERLLESCYIYPAKGYFVDQLWMNFIPVYFDGVKVMKEFCYNMAPWNLHERRVVLKNNDQYILNDNSILTFFHFSHYNYQFRESISAKNFYDRYTLADRPDLTELYHNYYLKLVEADVNSFSKYKCRLNLVQMKKETWMKKAARKILTIRHSKYIKSLK